MRKIDFEYIIADFLLQWQRNMLHVNFMHVYNEVRSICKTVLLFHPQSFIYVYILKNQQSEHGF